MENRFELLKREHVPVDNAVKNMDVFILRDKQTGVVYIANNWGSGGGLTPLLGKDGKPLTTFDKKI